MYGNRETPYAIPIYKVLLYLVIQGYYIYIIPCNMQQHSIIIECIRNHHHTNIKMKITTIIPLYIKDLMGCVYLFLKVILYLVEQFTNCTRSTDPPNFTGFMTSYTVSAYRYICDIVLVYMILNVLNCLAANRSPLISPRLL